MKLNDLFEEIKYGKEIYESSKSTDEIVDCYDTDYKKFFTSRRLTALSEGVSTDTSTVETVKKIVGIFEEVEHKETSNTMVYPIFYKMRLSKLVESYNSLVSKFSNVKYSKTIDRTKFGKLLGTIQYGVEYIAENASSTYTLATTPTLLQESVETELSLIESIVE